MIDLRERDSIIQDYARRYDDLRPMASPAIQRRMDGAAQIPSRTAVPAWLVPSTMPDLTEGDARGRVRGAMIGLAVGDALGATLEFQVRDAGTVSDFVGGGVFGLHPGEWTDDTTMSLCLADSLIERFGFDPADFAAKLLSWYRSGERSVNGRCFDIGQTTRTALETFERTGRSQSGPSGPSSAGNGSLVRVSTLVSFLRRSLGRAWVLSEAQSRATHNAAEALSACQLFAVMQWLAINGADKGALFHPKQLPLQPRPMIINAGEYKSKARRQIRSSEYVVDTLEAALWAVRTTETFEDAVLAAANLADDSDSVAAVAGQLAGALYGYDAIPEKWRKGVAWSGRIVAVADRLFDAAPFFDAPRTAFNAG